jgi:hypothetical protein
MADALFAALGTSGAWTALAQRLSTTTAFAGVTLRSVHTDGLPVFESTAPAHAGTNAITALPAEVAAVITLRTAGTGASNRGRIYIPGFATDAVGPTNIIGPAVMTDLQAWADTFIAAFAGQGMTLVVGNPARAGYTGTTGTVHDPRPAGSVTVTSLFVRDNHWDSQRRRGLK